MKYNKLEIERSKILFENEVLNFSDNIQNLILDAINGYLTVINYEKLLDTTKNAFQHKYGNYSKFKKKINEEIKEDKKPIGSYKKFMNKYL